MTLSGVWNLETLKRGRLNAPGFSFMLLQCQVCVKNALFFQLIIEPWYKCSCQGSESNQRNALLPINWKAGSPYCFQVGWVTPVYSDTPLLSYSCMVLAGSGDPWHFTELAQCRGDVFPTGSSVLRSRDYDSLGGELRHADGCSHVMPGFTLVSSKGDVWRRQPVLFGLIVNLFLELGCRKDQWSIDLIVLWI